MKFKRLTGVVLAVLCALTMLAACGRNDGEATGTSGETLVPPTPVESEEDTKRVIQDDDDYQVDDLFQETETMGDLQVGEPDPNDRWTPNY